MDQWIFVHIPKTAGTSFRLALEHAGLSVSQPFDATPITSDACAALSAFDIVSGHISMVDCERWFPGRKRITILRDPVERVVSWYWFARNTVTAATTSAEVMDAKTLPFEAFFSRPTVLRCNIVNRQVRQLAASALEFDTPYNILLARAKHELDTMAWVGLVETIDQDICYLSQVLTGSYTTLKLARENVARRDRADLSPAVRQNIEEMVWADIELYRYWQAKQKARRIAA